MISRMFWNLFFWITIAMACLFVLGIVLVMAGGSCWIAFAIWRAVFGFFM